MQTRKENKFKVSQVVSVVSPVRKRIIDWLDSKGGRALSDLFQDEKKKYFTIMSDANNKDVRVYLPDNLQTK